MKEIDGKLYGYSSELGQNVPDDDLIEFHAVDTGTIFLSYNGQWYEQRDAKWAKSLVSASSGGGGGSTDGLYITVNQETGALDHTWQEIHDAFPFVVMPDEEHPGEVMAFCAYCGEVPGGGFVVEIVLADGDVALDFLTDSADGYPVAQTDGEVDPGVSDNPGANVS